MSEMGWALRHTQSQNICKHTVHWVVALRRMSYKLLRRDKKALNILSLVHLGRKYFTKYWSASFGYLKCGKD